MTAFLQEEEREKRESKSNLLKREQKTTAKSNLLKREREQKTTAKSNLLTSPQKEQRPVVLLVNLKVKYPFVIDARVNSMLTACSVCGYWLGSSLV